MTLEEVISDHGYDTGWRCECGWTGTADEHVAHLAGVVREHLGHTASWDETRVLVARAIYESVLNVSWNRRGDQGEASAYRHADAALSAFLRAIGDGR